MKKVIYAVVSFAPVLAFAQGLGQLESLVGNIRNLINSILPVLLALGVLYFFWGLITFIRSAGDPKGQEAGKSIMIWGIVALFIMVSVFGLLNWISGTVGLNNNTAPTLPRI